MNRLRCLCFVATVGLLLMMGSQASAVALLAPGDPILAIDEIFGSDSWYPAPNETPSKILDAKSDTKYLNFSRENSGFIVTPAFGASIVQSFVITTANDDPARDPATWVLYGTNDAIASTDNSLGEGESWTLIGSGGVALPDARQTVGPVVTVLNAASYLSYRMVFPTLKNAPATNSMQIADVGFFQSTDGSGPSVLAVGDAILAIDVDPVGSNYPAEENPPKAIDGTADNKYLNFGREGSGFIVTPSKGATILQGFQITTANDSSSRDPASWEVYGTNDPITSADNSTGKAENWTPIASGTVALPTDRFALGPMVAVSNTTAYKSYRLVFPTVRDPGAGDCDSMQIGEIQFYGDIPEPSTAVLLAGLLLAGAAWCRRRMSR